MKRQHLYNIIRADTDVCANEVERANDITFLDVFHKQAINYSFSGDTFIRLARFHLFICQIKKESHAGMS